MLLPADNQTEGVIITDAPLASASHAAVESHGRLVSPMLGSPLTAPVSPTVTTPHLIPFRKVFRERWLWAGCFLSLMLLVLADQSSFNYDVYPDFGGESYTSGGPDIPDTSFVPGYIGSGWVKQKNDYNLIGVWTNGAGSIYIPNLGYVFSNGNYKLEIRLGGGFSKPVGPIPQSFTVTVGSEVIGTYPVTGTMNVSIPASAILKAGPDPVFTIISSTHPSPDNSGVQLGMPIMLLELTKPVGPLQIIPPIFTFFCVFLLNLLLYLVFRRHIKADETINAVTGIITLIATYAIATLAVNTQQANLQTWMFNALLIACVAVIIRWRRELANWVLHLRHPDDERFRLA